MARHRIVLIPVLLAATLAAAQTTPAPATPAAQSASATPAATATAPAATAPASQAATQPPGSILVPAGTRILLQLRSAINTKSAQPGDGVYLSSIFPVVVGDRVVIPAGVYVQGVVDSVVRPGRIRGRAQLNMHFTTIIFPNGSVVEVPGIVNDLPGAQNQKVKGKEGTIEQTGGSNKGRNAAETAEVAVPTGATIGSVGGLGSGHPMAGGLEGAGAGLAAAGIVALFTHKADVNIPEGTKVEMVLQRPLLLQPSNLSSSSALVPASTQPSTILQKPPRRRPHMLCPPGSLGCGER
jgi:hypothetical protein